MDTLPVADHEAAEVHPPLEDIGDELLVAVHLDRVAEAVLGPVDARERRHDAPDIMLLDGRHVLPQCLLPEVLTVGACDALVNRLAAAAGAVRRVAVRSERSQHHAAGRPARTAAVPSARSPDGW